MTTHIFDLKGTWTKGRNASGHINTTNLSTRVSIPEVMDGPEIGTNPDEMLLGAASTCYMITLAAMIERSEIEIERIEVNSKGHVDVENDVITYKKIEHFPVIYLSEEPDETLQKKLNRLVQKAEESCMVTRALAGNVQVIATGEIRF
ncbi:SACOL1771 family peroxiredoxin [Mammaliicoccus fleurettii]|uniref:SACOL1771 family peroxiredoxin n=1 Tax=Mammaliicoccus fleurettii TaxID=150056 RepID=A0ABS5MQX6_9STAP|nr:MULTISPECIES: SACOL1771 family peroxiredoxin [Mammaliicoccus]MBL0848226.1 SACOL1771 family peroxiredoxin [Mammaliicoccus fleurettii]MBS3672983.1 SACOL1771 family peroxiredoxin [Mammaliicoccus fleurettii]MBS3698066.1 SACOL1771 family peroxiredoxin [Mammaliicoccus fleurettii]